MENFNSNLHFNGNEDSNASFSLVSLLWVSLAWAYQISAGIWFSRKFTPLRVFKVRILHSVVLSHIYIYIYMESLNTDAEYLSLFSKEIFFLGVKGNPHSLKEYKHWLSGISASKNKHYTILYFSFLCMHVCSSLSCVQLFGTPWTVAHQAPLYMEFSRQEYWSGLPFPSSGDLPPFRDRTQGIPHCGQILYCLSHQVSPSLYA